MTRSRRSGPYLCGAVTARLGDRAVGYCSAAVSRLGERCSAHLPRHYGTGSGPACGARFHHDRLTVIGDTASVTCERCKKTDAFAAALRSAR